MDYRVDFTSIEWQSPVEGVRHKVAVRARNRLRLVEYRPTMEPHWCTKGHAGFILEGRLEIEFDGGTRVFGAGDGVFIPDGEPHRHRARVLSEVVRAVFVENA